ncbi:MAG: AraC family transcriptional regulator [Proteobacteria bacterium]|nr:AraC family transcriptional regulator [Pseudomonadota bacterium]
MTSIVRPATHALRPLVARLGSHDAAPHDLGAFASREHVTPTGSTHLVLRIGGPPIRVYDDVADLRGHRLGHAVVGGARAAYHVREVSGSPGSVGVVLRPGASEVLLGVPESALAGHHTALELLLGECVVDAMLGRLHACVGAEQRMALVEQWLVIRSLGRGPALHPMLAAALSTPAHRLERVRCMVEASGMSHRHWIALFRHSTGLLPREWLRLRRFAHAIEYASQPSRGWAEVAAASGFADQAHLANTFRTVAGVSPSEWRRSVDPAAPNHVPVRR